MEAKKMKLRGIELLETDNNRKGDLFCRLMGDLFHALGYDEPRFNVQKSGREIDLNAPHRIENRIAIAECKAHEDKIGGSDINKFIGVLGAEKLRLKKDKVSKGTKIEGYFISLSGFKETAIEQEKELGSERLILVDSSSVIRELIEGKIIVPIEIAVSKIPIQDGKLSLIGQYDLFAYEKGWVWVIYYSSNNGQTITHFALVHAEGMPLVKELADEIISLDKQLNKKLQGMDFISVSNEKLQLGERIKETKDKYFNYLNRECGEIQFEGLPADKEAGAVKVPLEQIFVPLNFISIQSGESAESEVKTKASEGIGAILSKNNKIAILAKPGGGKSTLIKRLAIAYAFPQRRKEINDHLPENEWLPIFIRCRELGEKVSASITEIINNVPNRAEIAFCIPEFSVLISEALQRGKALLLIDGIDEITDDQDRLIFVNQLRTFIGTYPKISLILTSREVGFRTVGGVLAHYCKQYRVAELNDKEIEELVTKWHVAIIDNSANTLKEAQAIVRMIVNDTRINRLAQNPLLLTTLLFVKRWAGYLPTKKSVLYQEMIKLLLVTWNVEGHEQIDIEEAEPQLAYVAFCMTQLGEQTVSLDNLKKYLIEARKEMPEILNYTRISVPDFIKRVESRSSLLIMSGHKKMESGLITPVYEFLHLSFQEHLTAKAIVNKYLPKKGASKTNVQIIKDHTASANWKEVIPLVAVLSGRDAKDIINFLLKELKAIIDDEKKSGRRIVLGDLLGNCIGNEIQITPELLDEAIVEYSMNHGFDRNTNEKILNGKFGNRYREKLKEIFFKEYNDNHMGDIGGLLGEIYIHDLKGKVFDEVIKKIHEDILSVDKQVKCISILGLMEYAFELGGSVENLNNERLIKCYEVFGKLLLQKDIYYNFTIYWSLCWLAASNLIPKENKIEFCDLAIKEWFNSKNHKKYLRFVSWSLTEMLEPDMKLDIAINELSLQNEITDRYKKAVTEDERKTSVFLGIIAGIKWERSVLAQLSSTFPRHKNLVKKFGAYLGYELN
jgi:hypothetical protein